MELNKFFNSVTREVWRSEIRFSDYNPRTINKDGRNQLKHSIKKYGIVGGIVINSRTNNTIVGGHQKVDILDELNKYNPSTKENDYRLKVEVVDIDLKTEKQLNIVLNNPNVGGQWDFNALARIVPDIDWKDAGLTDADLNMIGVDYLLQTEEESSIADALSDMMSPVTEQKEADKAAKQLERAEKVAHMKEVKQRAKENAQKTAEDMDAYVMLSFDTYEAKAAFCERFGYDADMKFIKGEVFDEQVERID
ncbi:MULTISPECIES: DNA methylase [unclassified Bacteroides]|jgi:ParB-like chromosome segregation protein Spo0J|uniref:DNA methylase n=1 Tax=unclassified Bacteroides TaxID=2646097 RepID=UPI000E9C4ECF|nr:MULTISPECIES: DNA methylase [unclassified Bacteroides]RGN50087.1 DNA methylase [Bacteroides sp. OM05-12]RHR75243.1 DNA methylase [Bacteroides sp. AF16-49]